MPEQPSFAKKIHSRESVQKLWDDINEIANEARKEDLKVRLGVANIQLKEIYSGESRREESTVKYADDVKGGSERPSTSGCVKLFS